jgi:2-C-methyl-D-erythritol 4-phosphate cytidylyltransferase
VSAADVDAVVLGAGAGLRMGGLDKLRTPLGSLPVILWSLRAFERAPSIRRVVVTASRHNRTAIEQLVSDAGLQKLSAVIEGGPSRAHSVLNALEALEVGGAAYVAVHDAARPFVTCELVERGAELVRERGAAVAAVSCTDTVKIVDQDRVIVETPPRARVWLAQTPQFARLAELLQAHRRHRHELDAFTDDVSLLEAEGIRAYVFEADSDNIKITTPADLEWAQQIAAGRRATGCGPAAGGRT